MHTLFENIKHNQVAENEADRSITFSVELDTKGFNLNAFLIDLGVDVLLDGSNKWVFKMQESDTAGSGQVDITDADKIAITIDSAIQETSDVRDTTLTVDNVLEDDVSIMFEYLRLKGCKRYITLVGTVTGTVATPMGVMSIQGVAEVSPVNS